MKIRVLLSMKLSRLLNSYLHSGDSCCLRLWLLVFLGFLNHLTPNDPHMGRTAKLTSRHCILYIYSTNIYILNILNMLHNLLFFFSSKCRLFYNASFFGSCIIHILNTGCAKI